MPNGNMLRMLESPLMRPGASERDFFSLVLAECALYGVPPNAIALFRDIHALLGYSQPLAEKQVSALSGPLITWRSFHDQPTHDRVVDVDRLAYQQRAIIAFGGGPPGEMVGRAEICTAMGNLLRGDRGIRAEYLEIFRWATIDTLALIYGTSREQVQAEKAKLGWRTIPDDEVINPTGRLYTTYQEITTQIRRESIAALEKDPVQHPRNFIRPWAAKFIEDYPKIREEAERQKLTTVVAAIDEQVEAVRRMFPDLGSYDDESERRMGVIRQALKDA